MSGEARLRSWFLRNLLEAAERELGAAALASLPSKVPARLRPHLSLDRLRTAVAVDGIPLDEGEEVLLALDQALGDGSGRMLERLSREMHARQLLQAKGTVRLGDLSGTVARLRGPLEHTFVDTEMLFELSRTDVGFTLTVGVPGRPRATRALCHLAQGAINAAERFAREGRETTRLYAETFADRAVITLNLRRASEPPPPGFDPPTLRRPPSIARMPASLSDEVARILDPSLAASRTSGQQRPSSAPKTSPGAPPSPSSAAPTNPAAFDAGRSSRASERPSAPSDTVFLRQRLPSNPPPSFPDIPTVTLRRPSEMPPAPPEDASEAQNESNRPTSIPPPRRSSRPPPSKP